MPPYLAGREEEKAEYSRLLEQDTILENLVLTGLRGVGKTVLLDTFKPMAISAGWLWAGTDLSEASSLTELAMATRLLTDLSLVTSAWVVSERTGLGFGGQSKKQSLDFPMLQAVFEGTPGLVSDKLKAVLELTAEVMRPKGHRGLIFAYDEAQNLADSSARDEYPLSLLLDVFQSIQRKGIPFMLVLTGLPTLFPKLVEARTFAERMFRVVTLGKLDDAACREAILKPVDDQSCPVRFADAGVATIARESGGYPYFIQFICREAYDVFLQQLAAGTAKPKVPINEITRKLDTDFFAGRWARATDRQRELLWTIAMLGKASDSEFTVQEVAANSRLLLEKPFGPSHINQMFAVLCDAGLLYKNRWGKYSFAVPLFDRFILRTMDSNGR